MGTVSKIVAVLRSDLVFWWLVGGCTSSLESSGKHTTHGFPAGLKHTMCSMNQMVASLRSDLVFWWWVHSLAQMFWLENMSPAICRGRTGNELHELDSFQVAQRLSFSEVGALLCLNLLGGGEHLTRALRGGKLHNVLHE